MTEKKQDNLFWYKHCGYWFLVNFDGRLAVHRIRFDRDGPYIEDPAKCPKCGEDFIFRREVKFHSDGELNLRG